MPVSRMSPLSEGSGDRILAVYGKKDVNNIKFDLMFCSGAHASEFSSYMTAVCPFIISGGAAVVTARRALFLI